jgi:uncharacterized protein YjbI with pentapeptide repeats
VSDDLSSGSVAADLAANRRYLDSGAAEGTPAQWIGEDLTAHDFTGAVLVEATLMESSFSECAMHGANLGGAEAGGARFDRAKLFGASFIKATLVEACFDDADATSARFNKARLIGASFLRARLLRADLDGANASNASFREASLCDASLFTTILDGADLSGADLTGVRFERTVLDDAIKLGGATGIDQAVVTSIVVGRETLEGDRARAWLLGQTRSCTPASWSADHLQLYLLAKMSGARVAEAVRRLGTSSENLRRVAAALGVVFDQPGHRAAEYRRILGEPTSRTPAQAEGMFAGSWREAYALPLWPDLAFVVYEDRNGMAWGAGFEGGPAGLPEELAMIEPWCWSAERLRREASAVEVIDEWTYDLDAILTFTAASGPRQFHARFDLGLLQSWTELVS